MDGPRVESVLRLENNLVRVTEWRFPPGAATGHHRHGFAYVVVPLTPGKLGITSATGQSSAELSPGVAYARPAGVEHDVSNIGDAPLAFVEIELLEHAG